MEEKQIVKRPRQDHVALSQVSVDRISKWIDQAGAKKKGVKISRKDLVNWLVERMPEHLSNGDLNALVENFYDERHLLRQLLRDMDRKNASELSDLSLEFVLRQKKNETKRENQAEEVDNSIEE